MDKDSLLQQNKLYIERNRQLKAEIEQLKFKLEELQNAVNERNKVIDALMDNTDSFVDKKEPEVVSFPIIEEGSIGDKIEKSDIQAVDSSSKISFSSGIDSIKLDDIQEYALNAVSELVIESAKANNKVTAGNYDNKKDLLNLIIGKSENAKYEITDIIISDCSDEQKKKMIDDCKKEAIEYIGCVLEQ